MNRLSVSLQTLLLLCLTLTAHSQLRINEVVLKSGARFPDSYNDFSDWIELRNTGTSTISLSGKYISRHRDGRSATPLPPLTLPAGEHLILRASEQESLGNNLLRLTGGGSGIDAYRAYESYTWAYLPIERNSDFTFSYRLRTLDRLHPHSRAGVVLREDTTTPAAKMLALLMDTYNSIILYNRRNVNDWAWQSPALMSTDLPNGYAKIEKKGNLLHQYTSLNGQDWFFLRSDSITFSGTTMFLGLAYSSGINEQQGYAIFQDVRLDNVVLAPEDFRTVSPFSAVSGTLESYAEWHLPFTLSNGGVTVFLTDANNNISDEMTVKAHPLWASFGLTPNSTEAMFLPTPTPGKKNVAGYQERLSMPTAEQKSGFYPQGTEFSFTAEENASIFYTTDGSEPTTNATLLTAALRLESSATIRVRAFQEGKLPSDILTLSYIIGEESPSTRVAHITIDTANLYSNQTGIIHERRINERFEHPGVLTLWDDKGSLQLQQDIGIRLHGQSSRLAPQKSFRMYSRGAYGTSTLAYPTFSGTEDFELQRLVIRNNGANNARTFLRDAFSNTLARTLSNMPATGYHPTILYINGEYRGIYSLQERMDERFIAQWYNIERSSIELLEDNAIPAAGSDAYFRACLDTLKILENKPEELWKFADKVIDLEHTFRHAAFQIVNANADWPHRNTKFWRSPEFDNKWRWELHDLDWAFDQSQRFTNSLVRALTREDAVLSQVLRAGIQHPNGKNLFINIHADLLNSVFLPDSIKKLWKQFTSTVQPLLQRHLELWQQPQGWDFESDNVQYFMNERPAIVREHIKELFSLDTTFTVTLNVLPKGSGTIIISTLQPKTYPWKGLYFKGVPVVIQAKAATGFRFEGWQNTALGDSILTLDLLADTSVTARFSPTTPPPPITINEIMYRHSTLKPCGDWIEIFNPTDSSLNISGYIIRDDDNSHIFTIPESTSLPAGGYLVIAEDTLAFGTVYGKQLPILGNLPYGLGRSDQVRIFTPMDVLVDSVAYTNTTPWYPATDGTGNTLELRHWSYDNTLPQSWHVSAVEGGTPGALNSQANSVNAGQNSRKWASLLTNPINSNIAPTVLFQLLNEEELRIAVYSAHGNTLFDAPIETNGSIFSYELPLQNMPSGAYYIVATKIASGESMTLPLMVSK